MHTDDGRSVQLNLKGLQRDRTARLCGDHPQGAGVTVDRTHVLATPDGRHGSYVALSRHRDGVDLHYGRDDFANSAPASPHPVARSRERIWPRTAASDPVQSYAERRGSPSASACRRRAQGRAGRLATCSTAFHSPGDVPGPDGGRRPDGNAERGGGRSTGAERRETEAPERKSGGRTRKRNCVACVPERSCAMPAPSMRSSRRRRSVARPIRCR